MQGPKQWLEFAKEDLAVSKQLIDSDHPHILAGMYHAQQSAEKSLKTYIIYKKHMPPRTHNLVELADICIRYDTSFDQILSAATFLNPFSISTRYPDSAFIAPYLPTAFTALKYATEILDFVVIRIELDF